MICSSLQLFISEAARYHLFPLWWHWAILPLHLPTFSELTSLRGTLWFGDFQDHLQVKWEQRLTLVTSLSSKIIPDQVGMNHAVFKVPHLAISLNNRVLWVMLVLLSAIAIGQTWIVSLFRIIISKGSLDGLSLQNCFIDGIPTFKITHSIQ